jgi:hypothetical protein
MALKASYWVPRGLFRPFGGLECRDNCEGSDGTTLLTVGQIVGHITLPLYSLVLAFRFLKGELRLCLTIN